MPWSADDGPVYLRLGAVTSAVYVHVNGVRVGYSQDSKLPAEFDVTEQVRAGQGSLVIVLQVLCWCDGAYLEDQVRMHMHMHICHAHTPCTCHAHMPCMH